MQAKAQRRQYGEPVSAATPEYSLRARHTRGVETEFVSITCSPLHIRTPRVHVPLRFLRKIRENQNRNGLPIKPLLRVANAAGTAPRTRDSFDAASVTPIR